MKFINPRTDLAFKKIFGSDGSRSILRSFLNAVLYEGEPIIVDLQIIDPYSIPRLTGMKDSYLDVRATLRDETIVLIEMQVLNVPGFEKRVLYNAAKEYANQLERGDDYASLNPVIGLTVTDFLMFEEEELKERFITRFALLEKDTLVNYPEGDVELVFVELPKFRLPVEELTSLTDKWLYFLKTAPDLSTVPEGLGEIPEIREAFEIARYANLTSEEERALEKKAQWLADQRALQRFARGLSDRNEELAGKNEELAGKNEELAGKNEELAGQNEELAKRADYLAERLRAAGIDPDES